MADLEEAIQVQRKAIDAIPQNHPDRADRARRLNILGIKLSDRYSRTRTMADLEEAIQAGREAIDAVSQDDPGRAMYLSNLGDRFGNKYSRTKIMADLEEAIQFGREAVDATPQHHPGFARRLNSLGIRLGKRYSRTGATIDLEEAVRVIQKAVDATPQNHTDRAEYLDNLGIGLGDKYSKTGTMANLEDAIRVAREAINTTPYGHPDRVGRLNSLGIRLGKRYSRTGVITDVEEAIRIIQETINAIPQDHPDRARYLNSLGNRIGDKYSRMGAMADLEEAIQIIQKAVDATSQNHPDRAEYLNNLGIRLNDKYSRTGATVYLEEAIRVEREAVNTTSRDYPNRALCLSNLGNYLIDKYFRTGAMADLEEGIRVGHEAVDTIPQDHLDRAGCLNNLGIGLSKRYSRTGAIADLEEAVRVAREAVKATPHHHLGEARNLSNLGIGLSNRYSRTEAITDLEEAIQVGRQAIDATPQNHPDRAERLSNLGIRLNKRYLRIGVMADLEEAIRIGREAVHIVPQNHIDRTLFLNNLGIGLSDRYSKTEAKADLEEAIHVKSEAVNAAPQDHPDRAMYLCNLGNELSKRYSRTGAIADIEEAIRVGREAVDTTPQDHPDRAKYLNDLGNRLSGGRYSGAMHDWERAISCFRSALHQVTSLVDVRVVSGSRLFNIYAFFTDWQRAFEASEIIFNLIPKLTSQSLQSSDKQHIAGQLIGLASDAAAVALHARKDPSVALNFLEQGRGILAASLQEMRTDILDLQEKYPKLAEQFNSLRDELGLSPTRSFSFIDEGHKLNWQAQSDRRYGAGKKFDELVIEIRRQPGFEDFLLASNKLEMQNAARSGPFIIVNVSQHRCDAIVVESHEIWSLDLPNLRMEDINKKAREGGFGTPKILEWLWDAVAHPILNALGYAQPSSGDALSHVWWIPTGPLSKFPLHAAGYHRKSSSETVLDRVMSSYSSSVKAIINGRQRSNISIASDQALLVAMDLPSARKEINMLHNLCKTMACHPIEPRQYKQDIVAHLPQCKIFHFAGHGCTDQIDPSQSYLLLKDGKSDSLTVANLLEMNIRKASPFLAYLSACSTGEIKDQKFLDESIHLISACQLAGFRHVIGTLWEVNDEICVDMARITYESMARGGMTDESVCRGLHDATRELRDRWLGKQMDDEQASRMVRKVELEQRLETTGISEEDRGEKRMPWVLSDNDSDREGDLPTGPLYWVPYVHFGV